MPRVYPPIDGKTTNHALPPSLVEVAAGFSAGVVSTLFVHPFDVVKTRLQVDVDTASRVGGSMSVIKEVYAKEGLWPGFYRGITPNLIGNSVSWAIYFLVYGKFKEAIQVYRGTGNSLQAIDYFAASGLSGVVTAFATNPIWVVKTRMLSTARNAPGAYLTMGQGFKELYNKEGLHGLYRGLVPSLFGVSHGAIQFMAYEKLKIWRCNMIAKSLAGATRKESMIEGTVASFKGESIGATQDHSVELTNLDFLGLSAVSKMFAGSITYPYQVVRSRLQTYDAPKKYKGGMDVLKQVWAKEGIAGFYKGLGPNIVRVLPSTCVTFLVYENTKIYLPRFYSAETAGRS